jgi:UDP-glucose 4-epimerase
LKVLVTGGAGFIGSWVVERLLRDGYKVVLLDDFSSGYRHNLERLKGEEGLSIIEGDIRDRNVVDQAAGDASATVHLAAVVGVDEATENPEYACAVNVTGTLNVLEAARWNRHSRFVFASSAAVYGEPKRLPIREDQPLRPVGMYGATKMAGEGFVHAFGSSYGLSTVALRLFNVYGPRQRQGPHGNVIQRFVEDSRGKQRVRVSGDGSQSRDFVFVSDVVDAIVLSLKSDATGAFNIGTGKDTTVKELARTFAGLVPGLKVERSKARPGDVKLSLASVKRAAAQLGWKAKVPLARGLKETLDYKPSV